MVMSDEDQAAVRAHIDRIPGGLVCPICRGASWNLGTVPAASRASRPTRATGLERALVYDTRKDVSQCPAANEFYVALLVVSCDVCYFVAHFLWDPIAKAARGDPAAGRAPRRL
jgi:hypothetical protein